MIIGSASSLSLSSRINSGPAPLGYRSRDKKLEVIPEEAGLVRQIFTDYLELGSIGALAAKLNRDGPKPKPRQLANGKMVQAECWRVGPLAHLLKNRFYIGGVVLRISRNVSACFAGS